MAKVKTFTYSLSVFERMIFLNVYPQKGHYTTGLLYEALSKKLITDEERNDIYQIKNLARCPKCETVGTFENNESPPKCPKCDVPMEATGRITWLQRDDDDNPIEQNKEITIGEMANQTITKALKELDEAEMLEPQHRSLYEKIVLGGKIPEIDILA